MMKFALTALTALALALPLAANAQEAEFGTLDHRTVGTCGFKALVSVKSFHVGVGGMKGEDRGQIVCRYINGTVERLPVTFSVKGLGLGVGFSRTHAMFIGAGIGIQRGGAKALLGKYLLADMGGQLIHIGGEVAVGMTANRNGITIPIGLQAKKGMGLEVAANLGIMKISAVND